ncbi:MAG: phosphate signaling complex protein PhoU [Betaproteobacteria bacterium]|nr:phosphate signaling complex protein PhoU [Betaproteobacteria bacterium]MCL2887031.1 phosphate signaling complex protein PhoU [Betaproteobacteria bacterium]
MQESQHHVSSQFDEELSRLRTHVLQMGGLVETQVLAAIDAYANGEVGGIKAIVDGDRRINELEKSIDDDCAHVIAKRQPTASDLRLVLGIGKIVTDLERSGDLAKKIAKGVRRIHGNGHPPGQFGVGIRHLAEAALNLVRQALDAFARLDTAAARQVIALDDEIDVEFKSIIRQLITHMMEDPRTITTAIDIITIARAIERIGDHAKNVSEQVIYIVEGRDIRYARSIKETAP